MNEITAGADEITADVIARKLDNADFVRRAPPEIVEETRERLAGFEQEAARLDAAIARITPVPAE